MKVENQLQASDAVSISRAKQEEIIETMLLGIMEEIHSAANNAVMWMTYDAHPTKYVAETVQQHLESLGYKVERCRVTPGPNPQYVMQVSWSK